MHISELTAASNLVVMPDSTGVPQLGHFGFVKNEFIGSNGIPNAQENQVFKYCAAKSFHDAFSEAFNLININLWEKAAFITAVFAGKLLRNKSNKHLCCLRIIYFQAATLWTDHYSLHFSLLSHIL